MIRFFALLLALFFLMLAVVGIFLPGLPTVPFLLLTAWFSARGSKRLHRWLYEHPLLGKLLNDWQRQRAIPRSCKLIAVLMLVLSWVAMLGRIDHLGILAGITVLFIVLSIYLITRPEPR